MPDQLPAASTLCGVRLARSGPVLYVDANGVDIAPDQLVVVQLAGSEALARVVFSPAQLVSNEPRVVPGGQISRAATEDDVARLLSGDEADNGTAAACLLIDWTEWFVNPGDEPAVHATPANEPSARAFIERLFPADVSQTRDARNDPRQRGTDSSSLRSSE
jgi:hypothetical protein